MNKDVNLSPFDWDAVGMIEQVSGLVPAVYRNGENFLIEWSVTDVTKITAESIANAIIDAVKGKLGERVNEVKYIGSRTKGNDITLDYSITVSYDGQEWPTQLDFDTKDPDENAGVVYVAKVREFKALRYLKDNVKDLVSFVGNGRVIDYTNTSKPEKTHFIFESESGLNITVGLGDYVVKENGHFFVMPADVMNKYFEFKYSN